MFESIVRRPTVAKINLDNLAFNFHSVKKFIGEDLPVMAVVKADAYGHGAVGCARRLEDQGVEWFGVALPEEGLELRSAGIQKPILCFGGFWNGQEEFLLENKITPVIFHIEGAESLDRAAKKKNLIADVHIKIDTGMGRIGVRFDEAEIFAEKLRKLKNLRSEAIMTHLAFADNLQEKPFTDLQIERFNTVIEIFEAKDFRFIYKDIANSPGAVAHENARADMVRLGGVLYGLGGDVLPKDIVKPDLKPVLSLHTEIALLKTVPKGETLGYSRTFTAEKDSLIATIPIGYRDGYSRSLSNRGQAIVGGKLVPIVGRVSMDWTILDVSDVENIKVNDEVILIGSQEEVKVTAEDIAAISDTISYEITCGIGSRVPRVYVEGE